MPWLSNPKRRYLESFCVSNCRSANRKAMKLKKEKTDTTWYLILKCFRLLFFIPLQGMRESNSHQRFWRPLSYHLTNPLNMKLIKKNDVSAIFFVPSKLHILFPNALQFHEPLHASAPPFRFASALPWSSPRPISNSQLHALLHFHLCPIYLVVFKGSYFFRMGVLISRGASRLDAFSVYPFRTWLPCPAPGSATGPPAVRPSRSSRTKDSSFQNSCAHAG